jgi:hypothetical protein
MSQIRVDWEESGHVTQRNSRRRLYFDPDRTRLVEDSSWYDLFQLRDKELAVMWCRVNDVDFFDHSITRYPKELRRLLLKARAAGLDELRRVRTQWVHVPWGRESVKLPTLARLPSESDCREAPRRKRSKVMESSDDGLTWHPV